MNESTTKSSRWLLIVTAAIGCLATLVYVRLRPAVIAESHSPNAFGGYIRIVEAPTGWFNALTIRYNPQYRFEYYWPQDHLWSAASFIGESYNAKDASIKWDSDWTATAFLDGHPYFRLQQDHLWQPTK